MLRDVQIEDIWDGRFYDVNDMVKTGCNDCAGCSDCCHGMENTILLDPLDICRMREGLSLSFEELISSSYIVVNYVDGLLLPNLKMGERDEACPFLNEQGRCSIHPFRPGICRIFPLGRYYEGDSFRYFLQKGECRQKNRYKVRVSKWIDTPDPLRYNRYIADWHSFTRRAAEYLYDQSDAESQAGRLYILQLFYSMPYPALGDGSPESFYEEFGRRLAQAQEGFS